MTNTKKKIEEFEDILEHPNQNGTGYAELSCMILIEILKNMKHYKRKPSK